MKAVRHRIFISKNPKIFVRFSFDKNNLFIRMAKNKEGKDLKIYKCGKLKSNLFKYGKK